MKNEKLLPTHVLHITVPLNLDERPYDYDAVQDAVTLALSISRAGFAGHICDGIRGFGESIDETS